MVTDPVRLAALRATELLDTAPEEAFDRLTRLAVDLLDAPMALVSLVDERRQFFKSAFGLTEPLATRRELPLTHSFCKHVVASGQALVVDDARAAPLVRDNPAVSENGVIAYVGVPLIMSDAQTLGALCAIDGRPRVWTDRDVRVLRELATSFVREVELRQKIRALDESEGKRKDGHAVLQCIVESIGDSVVASDREGKTILANATARRELASVDAMTPAGMSRARALYPDRALFRTDGTLDLCGCGEPAERVVVHVPNETGAPTWFSTTTTAIAGDDGTILGAVTVARDVSLQHRTQEALAESELRFRTLLKNLPKTMVLLFDTELRVVVADGAELLGNLGLTREKLLGRPAHEHVSEENRPRMMRACQAALEGKSLTVEGERGARSLSIHLCPVRDDAGTITGGMLMTYDVTELKHAQDELRKQTATLRSTVESMAEAVAVTDVEGKMILFNRATRELFGGTFDGNRSLTEMNLLYHPDGTTVLGRGESPLFRALHGDGCDDARVIVRPPGRDGPVDLSITARPIHDENGKLQGAVGVARDVTLQRASERLMREQMRVIELLTAVTVAANEAQSTAEALERSIADVCRYLGWPVGHVFVRDGKYLAPSPVWYLDPGGAFEAFRAESMQSRFAIGEGFVGKAAELWHPRWILALDVEHGFVRAASAQACGLLCGFAVPILVGTEVVAVLEFFSTTHVAPDEKMLSLMASVGTQLGRVVERERARAVLERHAQEVRELAIRDELTGLYNRRGFLELGRQHLRLAHRAGRHAAVLFVDLNGMKGVNDELGHEEGDRALSDTARLLVEALRTSDVVARLGGDEFAILALDVEPTQIHTVRARIQAGVERWNANGGRRYRLSLSVGISLFFPNMPRSIEELITDADSVMYSQKQARRLARANGASPFSGQNR